MENIFYISLACIIVFSTLLGGIYFERKNYKDKKAIIEGTKNNLTPWRKISIKHVTFSLGIIIFFLSFFSNTILSSKNYTEETIFLLDISKSMRAQDGDSELKLSREGLAKEFIQSYLSTFPDRHFGLSVFAGETKILAPLTKDHQLITKQLEDIEGIFIQKPGSNLRESLDQTLELFSAEKNTKKIFILSDGEEHDYQKSDLSNILKNKIQEKNIQVISMAIGTKLGALVPEYQLDNGKFVYKRYENNYVVSRINEENMKTLSSLGGKYFQIEQRNAIPAILEYFQNTQRDISDRPFLLSLLLLISLLLFTLEFAMKKGYLENISFQKLRHSVMIIGFLLLGGCDTSERFSFEWNQLRGSNAFSNQEYTEAAHFYKKSHTENLSSDISFNNTCVSYYQNEDFETAFFYCKEANRIDPKNPLYSFHLGNTLYKLGEQKIGEDLNRTILSWKEAIKMYNQTLELTPSDSEALFNKEFVEKKLQELILEKSPPLPKPPNNLNSLPSEEEGGNKDNPNSAAEKPDPKNPGEGPEGVEIEFSGNGLDFEVNPGDNNSENTDKDW